MSDQWFTTQKCSDRVTVKQNYTEIIKWNIIHSYYSKIKSHQPLKEEITFPISVVSIKLINFYDIMVQIWYHLLAWMFSSSKQ